MHDKPDPVDRALRSLRSCEWTGDSHNAKLEERLMSEFHTNRPTSFVNRHRTFVAILGIVLLSGAGFAAAGGTESVKKLFVTLQIISVDGEHIVEGYLEPIEMEGNSATFDVELGEGKQATLLMETLPQENLEETLGEETMTAITIQVDGMEQSEDGDLALSAGFGEAAGNVTLHDVMLRSMKEAQATRDAGESGNAAAQFGRAVHPIVRNEIDEPVFAEFYVDKDGLWQELSVVAEESGDVQSFSIYTTFVDEDDEIRYRRIGSMVGPGVDTTEVSGLDWDDDGLATISFVRDDGSEMSLKVDPQERAAGTGSATMTTIEKDGSTSVIDLRSVDISDESQSKRTKLRRIDPSDR